MEELLKQILSEQKKQTKLIQTIADSLDQSKPHNDDLNKKGNYNPLLFKIPIERKTPKYPW